MDHKWTGPYSIIERVGDLAYRLDLPGDLRRIHNVFHVDRLRPHVKDPFKHAPSPPVPIFIKGEPEHEVEAILDSQPICQQNDEIEYLIKWKGYGDKFNSWVEWEGMVGSLDLVKEWHKEHFRKRKILPPHLKRLEQLAQEDTEEDELQQRLQQRR